MTKKEYLKFTYINELVRKTYQLRMIMQIQLDLFKSPEECEIEALRFDLMTTKTSLEKVRKGTYASINELRKICAELEVRQKVIERNICQK